MEDSEIKAYIRELLQPVLVELNNLLEPLNAQRDVSKALRSEFVELQNRVAAQHLLTEQLLIERQAQLMNAIAVNDARFAALIAYLTGNDVQEAFVAFREKFRNTNPAQFDERAWNVAPEWLVALMRRKL